MSLQITKILRLALLLSIFIAPVLITLVLITPEVVFADNVRDGKYGIWESYGASWKHSLQYPDFRLNYVEKKENAFYPGSTEKRLSPIYVFEVVAEDKKQMINWTQGTGDIGPVYFLVDGNKFVFEMLRSEVADGTQPDHKVLIWKEADFLKMKSNLLPK